MNILHINTTDKGGAFQAAYRLHRGLLANNLNSKMLVLYQHQKLKEVYPYLSSQSIWQKIKHSFKYRLFEIKKRILLSNKPKTQFSFAYSPYNIEQHPLVKSADIINLHWTSNFLNYASFFKNIDKPIVWTLHDMNPFMGGFHYKNYELKEYEILNKRIIEQKEKAYNSCFQMHIVAPSYWLFMEAQKSSLLKKFSNYHIPYGLDTTHFKSSNKKQARQFFNLPLEKKIVLFVSDTLEDERKGFKYLIEAWNIIQNENILLVTLGKNLTNKNLNNIICLGFITETSQIAMAYSAADIFVIPSIEDNLPNTVLEAMACSTPIIGFGTGGIKDMIRDGYNGLIANYKDSKDLANRIVTLLTNDVLRGKMGDNSREIAVNEYDVEIQSNRYIELYENILKS